MKQELELHEPCGPNRRAITPRMKRYILARIFQAWTANESIGTQRLGQLLFNAAYTAEKDLFLIEDDDLADWVERFSRGVR